MKTHNLDNLLSIIIKSIKFDDSKLLCSICVTVYIEYTNIKEFNSWIISIFILQTMNLST